MKNLKEICLSVIILTGVVYKAYNQDINFRKIINIDTGWRFHFGHAADPRKDFNYGISNLLAKSGKAEECAINPGFDDRHWQKIDLPHDWAVGLPCMYSDNPDVMAHGYKPVGGLFPETSIGWYRTMLKINPSDSGKKFYLKFDGVFRDASFWLNGFYLGTNESGYIGVTYNISDYIDFNRENVLVVRVNATQYEGWFYEGAGIYRHVWLLITHPVHFDSDGLFITTELTDDNARVRMEYEVVNSREKPINTVISAFITDPGGKLVSDTVSDTIGISSHQVLNKYLLITVDRRRDSVNLWSPEHPYLYRAHLFIRDKGTLLDRIQNSFGIRTLHFDPAKGFFLNGESVKIKGVNCHQDHACVGTAFPDYLHSYRIKLLKEMGVNAYRTSHHPPAPELLDACDSLGMLVLDENRLVNSSPEYIDQFTRIIKRDRNHPSVFLWSIGNEEGLIQANGTGKRIAKSLINLQKELDPSRTCTYAADLPNVFNGINEVIPVRGFNYRQFAVADYHNSHPGQPIVGTEMGSTVTTRGQFQKDTIRGYLPDQDITAPWWASTAETWWKLCAGQPWWMGGFIWTGFDYRGEPTPFSWPNINSHFGVMDMCGFPKNLYYYYQSWWLNTDVLHISPHWNHPGGVKEGDTVKVWINSNAEVTELLLNHKSFGKKIMPVNGHLCWQIPFLEGKLTARAFRNGHYFEQSIETTGKAVTLKLNTERQELSADGKDIAVINVTALDANGREVPDANSRIEFLLRGDGKILGTGNGDPSDHEPEMCLGNSCSRKLFNGKCQLILQSGHKPDHILLQAQGEQWPPVILTINSH